MHSTACRLSVGFNFFSGLFLPCMLNEACALIYFCSNELSLENYPRLYVTFLLAVTLFSYECMAIACMEMFNPGTI